MYSSKTKHVVVILIACALPLTLSGCSFLKAVGNLLVKTAKVWVDPSIPVGDAKENPSLIALSLSATYDVNPNPFSDTVPPDPEEIDQKEPDSIEYVILKHSTLAHQITGKTLAVAIEPEGRTVGHLNQEDLFNLSATRVNDTLGRGEWAQISQMVSGSFSLQLGWVSAWFIQPVVSDGLQYTELTDMTYSTKPPRQDVMPDQDKHNESGSATPVNIMVIQLRDDSLLLGADFDSLQSDLAGTLKSTYIKHDDYVLTPGQYKYVDFSPLESGCKYLAVVAAFNVHDNAIWKSVAKLEPNGHRYPVFSQITADSVILHIEE